jgi:hypothetical protein
MFKVLSTYSLKNVYKMQNLEGSSTPVLYRGRTVLKGKISLYNLRSYVPRETLIFCRWYSYWSDKQRSASYLTRVTPDVALVPFAMGMHDTYDILFYWNKAGYAGSDGNVSGVHLWGSLARRQSTKYSKVGPINYLRSSPELLRTPVTQKFLLDSHSSIVVLVFNPWNAELNPICHLLVLLRDLTFMGPCVVSTFQYISYKMQCYTVYLYLETALHVSDGTYTPHQERIQLYLQHLVFVTTLLLSDAIVEEFEPVWVCSGWRTPPTAHSNYGAQRAYPKGLRSSGPLGLNLMYFSIPFYSIVTP